MGDVSIFESRVAKIRCNDETFYSFITDIRNFKTLVPAGTVTGLVIDKDSCSFNVSMLGNVTVRISEKVPADKVVFSGNALQINDFQIIIKILEPGASETGVKLILTAHMNPFLKMVAAEPVKRFLETIVNEMEKFKGWDTIIGHNQSL